MTCLLLGVALIVLVVALVFLFFTWRDSTYYYCYDLAMQACKAGNFTAAITNIDLAYEHAADDDLKSVARHERKLFEKGFCGEDELGP
jgi:hypothetical protein